MLIKRTTGFIDWRCCFKYLHIENE